MTRPDTQQLSKYTYDPKSLRYKDRETGRFVSAQEVRAAADVIIDKETLRVQDISRQLIEGKMSLAEWQVQTSVLLKNLHVAMGLAACGGLNNISASDLGYLASQIKEQYHYLRDFALEIKRGEQRLDGSLMNRASMYTQACRGIYENMLQRRAKAAGLGQERSVLDGAAEHCSQCEAEAGKGWVEVGTLIPIGQRQCMSRCRCHFVYRAGEAA